MRAAWLVLLAGCGYSVGPDPRYRAVELEAFDNRTDRRLEELELTRAVARELEDQGVRVNTTDATHTLRGEIISIREPRLVEGPLDALRVGSIVVGIRLEFVERSSGRVVWTREHYAQAETAPERARTFDAARAEAFDRIAQWTARQLERPW